MTSVEPEPTLPPVHSPSTFTAINVNEGNTTPSAMATKGLFDMNPWRTEEEGNDVVGPIPPSSSSALAHSDDSLFRILPEDADGTPDIRSLIKEFANEALSTLSNETITPVHPTTEVSSPAAMPRTKLRKLMVVDSSDTDEITNPKTPQRSEKVEPVAIEETTPGPSKAAVEEVQSTGNLRNLRSATSSTEITPSKIPDDAEVQPPKSLPSNQGSNEDTQDSNDSQITNNINVLFSKGVVIGAQRARKLEGLGAAQVNTVAECDIFCVKDGPLTRSAHLVLSIAIGKPVVSDTWISACIKANSLVQYGSHLATNSKFEKAMSVNLKDAIQRGKDGCKPLEGYEVLITATKRGTLGAVAYKDLTAIAEQAGATKVANLTRTRLKVPQEKRQGKYLAILDDNKDPEFELAMEKGWRCYKSDIITVSVLRGLVDENSDEFLLKQPLRAKRASEENAGRGVSKKRKTV